MPDLHYEILNGLDDGKIICGIDEVGCGPLAGPVMAAAVVLPREGLPEEIVAQVNDSKKLTEKRREALFPILTTICAYAVGEASVQEIDKLNILQARLLAMQRAVDILREKIGGVIDCALVDGNRRPMLGCETHLIVKGDSKSLSIAAASIIAKVTRDRLMKELAQKFPGYGWEKNAGYGTAAHLAALRKLGPTVWHRDSFAPVSQLQLLTE